MKKLCIVLACSVLALSMISGCAKQDEHEVIPQEPEVSEPQALFEENVVAVTSKRDTKITASFVVPTVENENGYPLVILAHGFLGSREESGSFTEVAAGLAENGIASIRLDFPGCNESEDTFMNYTLYNMVDDVNSVLAYAKENAKINEDKIGILGYSMGGRVAVQSLESIDADTVVLWAPAVSDGLSAMQLMGNEEELNQIIADSEGKDSATILAWGEPVDVAPDFLTQIRDTNPTQILNEYKGNLMFVLGGVDDVVIPEISSAGIEAATNTNITAVTEIPRIGHGLGSYDGDMEARKVAVNTTVHFFADYLNE